MSKIITMRLFAMILMPAVVIAVHSGCKKNKTIEIQVTSHSDGDVVYDPLPIKMKGVITNYKKLSEKQKAERVNLYIAEQCENEVIWHLEPRGTVDAEGNWTALTWLGNPNQGRRSDYTICLFISPERLVLNDGDHPVKEKPPHTGETCITLKRRD